MLQSAIQSCIIYLRLIFRIKVNFSVNNSVENVSEQDEESSPELRSKPVFSVMIETSEGTLELQCSFIPDDEVEEDISKSILFNSQACTLGTGAIFLFPLFNPRRL